MIEITAQQLLDIIKKYTRVLSRLSVDTVGALRVNIVTTVAPALAAGSAVIGYTAVTQKLLASAYVDSTTNLGANAVFTGTSRTFEISSSSTGMYAHFGTFQVSAYANVAGTLFIQESSDNSTWQTVYRKDLEAIVDTDGSTTIYSASNTWKPTRKYGRVMFRNGSGAQGTFHLDSRVASS